jgi:hypothetical protein
MLGSPLGMVAFAISSSMTSAAVPLITGRTMASLKNIEELRQRAFDAGVDHTPNWILDSAILRDRFPDLDVDLHLSGQLRWIAENVDVGDRIKSTLFIAAEALDDADEAWLLQQVGI